jgi:hypothetical protein
MRRSDGMGFALRGGDLGAALWAIACCWAAVWGNYLLLAMGLQAAAIVPFDLFAVPALVSLAFWTVGRLRR